MCHWLRDITLSSNGQFSVGNEGTDFALLHNVMLTVSSFLLYKLRPFFASNDMVLHKFEPKNYIP